MYQDFSPFCGWLLLHATEMALGVSPFIHSWSRELFHGLAVGSNAAENTRRQVCF